MQYNRMYTACISDIVWNIGQSNCRCAVQSKSWPSVQVSQQALNNISAAIIVTKCSSFWLFVIAADPIGSDRKGLSVNALLLGSIRATDVPIRSRVTVNSLPERISGYNCVRTDWIAMITSWHGKGFTITGALCWKFIDHMKKDQHCVGLRFSSLLDLRNCWRNSRPQRWCKFVC